eukprot:413975-Amphidinium_carterae.1
MHGRTFGLQTLGQVVHSRSLLVFVLKAQVELWQCSAPSGQRSASPCSAGAAQAGAATQYQPPKAFPVLGPKQTLQHAKPAAPLTRASAPLSPKQAQCLSPSCVNRTSLGRAAGFQTPPRQGYCCEPVART